jgi:CDP-diglyceride synthetase
MGLLGFIIVACGILYISECYAINVDQYRAYLLRAIGFVLLIVIGSIVYYSIKAHAQRSKLKAFKDDCEEIGMLIGNKFFLSNNLKDPIEYM